MPTRLRALAAAAALTLAGLGCVAWASLGSPTSPDAWTGAGVAMLAASGLIHWQSSRA